MDNVPMWIVSTLAVGIAVFVGTYLPAHGRLPRNSAVGIRLPALGRSEAAWTAGHRAALPWAAGILAISILGAVIGMILQATSHDPTRASLAPITTFVLGVVGLAPMCLAATRAASRA